MTVKISKGALLLLLPQDRVRPCYVCATNLIYCPTGLFGFVGWCVLAVQLHGCSRLLFLVGVAAPVLRDSSCSQCAGRKEDLIFLDTRPTDQDMM
jgi:hypothetical protein